MNGLMIIKTIAIKKVKQRVSNKLKLLNIRNPIIEIPTPIKRFRVLLSSFCSFSCRIIDMLYHARAVKANK